MKKLTRLTAVLLILLAFTGIAAAGAPELGPFSTTGYTYNLSPTEPPPIVYFPSGYTKFHFLAQGGGVEDEATCQDVYSAESCQQLCKGVTGKPCGVAGELVGSFTFDEVGLFDPELVGANSGSLTINTNKGEATLKFSGTSTAETVTGAFDSQKMKGDFKELKIPGIYNGNAGLVFTVDYDPCAKNDGLSNDLCAVNRCAVFGDELKIEKDKVKWKIRNEGKQPITISSVLIHWSADSLTLEEVPTLKKVKLGGKTLAEQPDSSTGYGSDGRVWAWTSIEDFQNDGKKDPKDREIDKNKMQELSLEFDKKGADIGANPWDYTILVEFDGGCAVPFVAFAP